MNITVQWYVDVNVTDAQTGGGISGVTVQINDSLGRIVNTSLTEKKKYQNVKTTFSSKNIIEIYLPSLPRTSILSKYTFTLSSQRHDVILTYDTYAVIAFNKATLFLLEVFSINIFF